MEQKKYQEFMKICRNNGWKCTSQRLAVYDFVHENDNHPSVDDVWRHVRESLPVVTRESVYRILNEFSERGILQRLDHIDSAKYDCRTGPQGHFICQSCGDITDFTIPEEAVLSANTMAGEVRNIELRLIGICERCKSTV